MKIKLHNNDLPRGVKIYKSVAIDTETTSLLANEAELVGISMALEPGKACYIPIGHKKLDITFGRVPMGG